MKTVLAAVKAVFSTGLYRAVGTASFILFLTLYLLTLPATFTGGQMGWVSLQFLTPKLAILAVAMAALLAVIVPFIFYLLQQGQKARMGTTASGALIGLMAPLLCCSPILPIALGFAGGLLPVLGGFGGGLQGFVATHETGFFLAALALLVYALYQNAKTICEGLRCRV